MKWVGSLNPVLSVCIHSTMFYQLGSWWSVAVATLSRVTIAVVATATPLKTSANSTLTDYSKHKSLTPRRRVSSTTHKLMSYLQHGCIKNRTRVACASTTIRSSQKKKRFQFHLGRTVSKVPNRVFVLVLNLKVGCGGGDAASLYPYKKSNLYTQPLL